MEGYIFPLDFSQEANESCQNKGKAIPIIKLPVCDYI